MGEQVVQVAVLHVGPRPTGRARGPLAPVEAGGIAAGPLIGVPVGAQPVVLLTLLRVAQHLVGLVGLLEAGLGLLVVRVDVRVILARQLAVRFLDLFLVCVLIHAQDLVVVFVIHVLPVPKCCVNSCLQTSDAWTT